MAVETEAQTGAPEATTEERLSAFFGGEPAAKRSSPEPQPEPPAAEPDEPDEVEAEQDAEAADEVNPDDIPTDDEGDEPSAEDADLDIPWNGQSVKIPKDKVRDYVQQGYNLERNREAITTEMNQTQARAVNVLEAIKGIEQTAPQLYQLRTAAHAMEMMVSAQGLTPQNILQVARQDPARAQEMQAEFNVRVAEFNNVRAQIANLERQLDYNRKAAAAELEREEQTHLLKINPNLKDRVQLEKARTLLAEQMGSWRQKSIEAAVGHAEVLDLLIDGAKYRNLQKTKKASLEKAASKPQVLRPGSATSVAQGAADKMKNLRTQLRKTGSVEDAARLFMERMK